MKERGKLAEEAFVEWVVELNNPVKLKGWSKVYELYAVIILIAAIGIGVWRSINTSRDAKYRVWGITTMLIFAPVFSWLLGSLYGLYEKSGFAMMGVFIIAFPLVFITGGVLYWIGGREV